MAFCRFRSVASCVLLLVILLCILSPSASLAFGALGPSMEHEQVQSSALVSCAAAAILTRAGRENGYCCCAQRYCTRGGNKHERERKKKMYALGREVMMMETVELEMSFDFTHSKKKEGYLSLCGALHAFSTTHAVYMRGSVLLGLSKSARGADPEDSQKKKKNRETHTDTYTETHTKQYPRSIYRLAFATRSSSSFFLMA